MAPGRCDASSLSRNKPLYTLLSWSIYISIRFMLTTPFTSRTTGRFVVVVFFLASRFRLSWTLHSRSDGRIFRLWYTGGQDNYGCPGLPNMSGKEYFTKHYGCTLQLSLSFCFSSIQTIPRYMSHGGFAHYPPATVTTTTPLFI